MIRGKLEAEEKMTIWRTGLCKNCIDEQEKVKMRDKVIKDNYASREKVEADQMIYRK